MKSFKIDFTLHISPLKTHFGKLIQECDCGDCPELISKKDTFIINEGEEYYCKIMKKIIKVFDDETAADCFKTWFLEGESHSEYGNIIPEKQKNFYNSEFFVIEENEFEDGVGDIELSIDSVSLLKLS